jgi:hypothetical protein
MFFIALELIQTFVFLVINSAFSTNVEQTRITPPGLRVHAIGICEPTLSWKRSDHVMYTAAAG